MNPVELDRAVDLARAYNHGYSNGHVPGAKNPCLTKDMHTQWERGKNDRLDDNARLVSGHGQPRAASKASG